MFAGGETRGVRIASRDCMPMKNRNFHLRGLATTTTTRQRSTGDQRDLPAGRLNNFGLVLKGTLLHTNHQVSTPVHHVVPSTSRHELAPRATTTQQRRLQACFYAIERAKAPETSSSHPIRLISAPNCPRRAVSVWRSTRTLWRSAQRERTYVSLRIPTGKRPTELRPAGGVWTAQLCRQRYSASD